MFKSNNFISDCKFELFFCLFLVFIVLAPFFMVHLYENSTEIKQKKSDLNGVIFKDKSNQDWVIRYNAGDTFFIEKVKIPKE